MQDGLVGAAVAVGVLLVVTVIGLWWLTDPAADEAPTAPTASGSAGGAAPTQGSAEPPSDLAAGQTWLGDFTLDAGALATPDARLHDVRAIGSDARTGPDGLVVGTLTVDATVPFDVVADQIGGRTTIRPADDPSQATVVRTVEVVGRELRVAATGTIDVERGRLVIEPQAIDIGGPDFLAGALAGVVRRLVTIDQSVDGLPDGLVLQDVVVQDDGFRATLRGDDVVLSQQ